MTTRAAKILLTAVAALALGGCMSKSQFSGRYLDGLIRTNTIHHSKGWYRLEIRTGSEIAYNFWGHSPVGGRMDYTVTSNVGYPLCVKLTFSKDQIHHYLEARHDIEYRVEPYKSVWVASGLTSTSLRGGTNMVYDVTARAC